jgi:hypothetical protein
MIFSEGEIPMPVYAFLKNKRRVAAVSKTLNEIAAGKDVSKRRLASAQALIAEMHRELNSRRPLTPIYCCGRVPPEIR